MKWIPSIIACGTLLLSGCVTDPRTGQQTMSKTAMYGLGAAVTCGIVGGITHGGKGARNAALACGAVGAGVGGYMDYQEKLLREKLQNTQIEVAREGNDIRLTMPESVTFATNSAQLNRQALYALNDVADVLSKYNETNITIAGHADSTGSDAINQPLSERRAQSVAGYLQNQGVAAYRVHAVGYGSRRPIASNATAAGRAQNRRVEILINPQH